MVRRGVCLLLVALLLAAPMVTALNVATRSIKARPAVAYSPDTAWEEGYQGCNVTIAVFDEGVDDEHPYFAAEPAAAKDTTGTEPLWQGANDGNPQPMWGGHHGTPVAGIALSNAGEPFTEPNDAPDYSEDALVGVAPCAHLIDVQFLSSLPTGESPVTDTIEQNQIQAFEWAIEHRNDTWGDEDPTNDGIDVITMSWSPDDGTDGSDSVCQATTRAVEAGIVVLGSAGNSGTAEEPDLGCPTGADGAISVANLDNQRTVDRSDDELTDSSTWGPRTDDGDEDPYEELKPTLAAPGRGVVSTGASLADGREYALACFGPRDTPPEVPDLAMAFVPTCETSFGGTSAATPMMAGVVALVLEANPELQPAGVKAILQQTAEPHEEMERSAANLSAQWDHRYGYGMVDAHAAVEQAERWPGIEKGRDRDADGIRDLVDDGPADPSNRNVTVPQNLTPEGGDVDTDGDGVVDAVDQAPLHPGLADEPLEPPNATTDDEEAVGGEPLAPQNASTDEEEEDPFGVPGPGLAGVALAAVAAAGATRVRRRVDR